MPHTDIGYTSDFITKEYFKEVPLYSRSDKVLYNGTNNLRPNEIEYAINNSPVAIQCANTYKAFLIGAGFSNFDNDLSLYGWETYTINDLLGDICESVSRHGGAFIHVTYDGNLNKRSFKVLPYQNCRIGLSDDTGYISTITYRPLGWTLHNQFNGYRSQRKNNKQVYVTYNTDKAVLSQQVELAGGIEKFAGQVLYFRLSDKYPYSQSLLEPAIECALADGELNRYYHNLVRGGFQDVKLIKYKRFKSQEALDKFKSNINKMVGSRNANSVMLVQDDFTSQTPDGTFRTENLGTDVNAGKYQHIEDVASSKLRRSFLNIPHQLIEQVPGKLASTSELMEAIAIYNTYTADHRNRVERLCQNLLDGYQGTPTDIGTIGLYSLLEDGSIAETPEAAQEPPLAPSLAKQDKSGTLIQSLSNALHSALNTIKFK